MFRCLALVLTLAVICTARPEESQKLEVSNEINEFLDKSVNPCDNFYKFACGKYKQVEHTDNDGGKTTVRLLPEYELQQQLNEYLKSDEIIFDKQLELPIKTFYKSCFNTEATKTKGYEPWRKLIASFGPNPLLANSNFDESKFDFMDFESKLQQYGFNSIFTIFMKKQDYKINFMKTHFPYNPGHGTEAGEKKWVPRITEFIKQVFDYKNLDLFKEKTVEEFAKEVYNFETEVLRHDYDVNNEHLVTVSDLSTKFPQYKWTEFFKSVVGTDVDPTTKIDIYDASYIEFITKLVEKTPKPVVVAYMLYHAMNEFWEQYPLPKGDLTESWKYCTKRIVEQYGKEVTAILTKKYSTPEVEQEYQEMFKQIITKIKENLLKSPKFKEASKKVAEDHLNKAKLEFFGVVKENEVVHRDIELIGDEYYTNLFNKLKWDYLTHRTNVYNGKDDDTIWYYNQDFHYQPLFLQIRGDYVTNTVQLSSNHMNPLIFKKYLPKGLKFSEFYSRLADSYLGTLSVQYDIWMTDEAKKEYDEKSKCLNDQLKAFTRYNGGLSYAFNAYKDFLAHATDEEKLEDYELPGIENNKNQLFFIGYAQGICRFGYRNFLNDEEELIKFVNVPLMNYLEFSEEFKCPEGSPMNLKDKCEVQTP